MPSRGSRASTPRSAIDPGYSWRTGVLIGTCPNCGRADRELRGGPSGLMCTRCLDEAHPDPRGDSGKRLREAEEQRREQARAKRIEEIERRADRAGREARARVLAEAREEKRVDLIRRCAECDCRGLGQCHAGKRLLIFDRWEPCPRCLRIRERLWREYRMNPEAIRSAVLRWQAGALHHVLS